MGKKKTKRVVMKRRLTPEEASRHKQVRDSVEAELPEIIARRNARREAHELTSELVAALKQQRESLNLSLADMEVRTGMDRAALSRFESGQRENPTVETIVRYATAVGMRPDWRFVPLAKR